MPKTKKNWDALFESKYIQEYNQVMPQDTKAELIKKIYGEKNQFSSIILPPLVNELLETHKQNINKIETKTFDSPLKKSIRENLSLNKKEKTNDPYTTTVSDLFKYRSLSKYSGLEGKKTIRAGTTFIGLEVELEGVKIDNIPPSTWNVVEDNSLKDQGKEFVTIPIQFKYLEIELERLFQGLDKYNSSSRCSVHVHINARDFTLMELKNFILLYMVFEKSLYNFSGNRINNNFCVPLISWTETVKYFLHSLDMGIIKPKWYKYFGFNLSPIFGGESKPLGTIEFRHMEGTTDIERIINWINLLVSIKIAAKKITNKALLNLIETMNTTSGYYWLAEKVFKEFSPVITKQKTFKEDVEHCITTIKSILVSDTEKYPPFHEEIPIIKTGEA